MRKLLFILCMMVCANFIFAQTAEVSLGAVYDPPPASVVQIPITINNIANPSGNSVSGFAFYFSYNASVCNNTVTFTHDPVFSGVGSFVTSVTQNTPIPGWNTVAVVYATGDLLLVNPGQLVTTAKFNYISGATNLNWTDAKLLFEGGFEKTLSYLVDFDGNVYTGTWNNGCVCISGYDITFQVTDENSLPLQDALVTMGTESILTNASGEAVFNRPNGNYPYTVTKAGYYNVSNSVTVSGTSQTVQVPLFPLGSQFDVTFHVTDGTNNLEGAMVTVGSQSLLTDINGDAVFSLVNGNYNYTVNKYGYTSDAGSFIVIGIDQTINVQLTMLPHYDITFHVTSGGNNIEGASIEIPDIETLQTDVNGNAVFSLIDGPYNYTITKTGFEVKTGTTTVAGSPYTIEETLTPLYEVTFHVTSGGSDLEGATVTVGAGSVVTDATGIALFNLPDGDYTYTVTKPGYNDETGNFTIAGTPISLEVSMSLVEFEITFHVTSGGNNLEGVLIQIDNGESATTDVNGIAILMIPDGEYVYTASKEGYGIIEDILIVSGGPVTVEISMIPNPTYAITFHVTSDGTNLEGADVTIGTQTISTNSSGIAVFNLENGPYDYTVTKLGYINQNGNFLIINGPMTIEVVMPLFEWSITFHVTSGGVNLTGATVTVNPGNITGITGTNGNALLNLVNGSYTYTVEKANYVTQTGSFVVNNANQTIEVSMPLSPWSVTFHIVSTGGALAGVNVTCNGQTVVTDASGNAVFNLTNGTYDYIAEKPGYHTLTGSITVNNAPLIKNLIMFPITVTFVVTNNGQPIQNAEVTLTGFPPQTTPANGTVVFSVVPNGTYPWTVTHPDYGLAEGDVTVNNANVNVPVMLVGVYDLISSSFNLYPNPSNGTFNLTTTVSLDYESDITVFDLTGKLVYTGKLQGNDVNVIDLSAQEKGMYILQIIVEDKVYNKTLVIQ